MNDPRNISDAEVLAYNRARLESLLQMVIGAIPSAKTCFSANGSFGYVSATIGFANGLEVLAACDADLPQALFEIVRLPRHARRCVLGQADPRGCGAVAAEVRGCAGGPGDGGVTRWDGR